MDKQTNRALMKCAEQILNEGYPTGSSCPLFKDSEKKIIFDSYNGQASALGVSILMIGLCPTLAVYIQDAPASAADRSEAYRIYLLDVIARMLEIYKPEDYGDLKTVASSVIKAYDDIKCRKAYNLTHYVLKLSDSKDEILREKILKTDILNCSVALKEVIRTYTLG